MRICVVLLMLTLQLMGGAQADPLPMAAVPIARLSDAGWRARHEAKLAEARRGPVDLVLLGDSITQDYEHGPATAHDFSPVWARFYADRHALNLGFGGDTTSQVLWRVMNGEIDGIAPKAAIILIGTNNLGQPKWPASDTVLGIETLVDEVHRRQPQMKILLLSVPPSWRGPATAQAEATINAALAARYGGGAVPYVRFHDLTPLFTRDGKFDHTWFIDALHPTPEGQARMAAAIEPDVSAMLGDRLHS
jgi:lysophospholipase L1-like esterase